MAQKEAIAAALSIARRAKKAAGGSAATVSWQQRASARGLSFAGGMIKSAVPGRTDKLNLNVPAGAYVLPADVPSALGQGNTMAGGKILNQMFSVGMNRPARVRPPRLSFGRRGRGMFAVGGPAIDPLQGGGAPPPVPGMPPAAGGMPGMPQAMPPAGMPPGMPGMAGPPGMMPGMPGAMPGMPPDMTAAQPMLPPATTAEPEPDSGLPMPDHAAMAEPEAPAEAQSEEVPIIAAGGEYVIPPEKVQEIGGGDLDRGHEILDAFVKLVRKQHVKTLRKLPPPKVN